MKKIINFLTKRDFEAKVPDCLFWLNIFFPIDVKFDISYLTLWLSLAALLIPFIKG